MKHIEGIDRNQITLMPDAIEDFISEDNPVRFLDIYIDHLDLKDLGFPRVEPETRGRPPYHPGDLLRLYLYGYLFAIPSSRALEREANRNLELIWLLKRLAPDFPGLSGQDRQDHRRLPQSQRKRHPQPLPRVRPILQERRIVRR